MTKKRLPCIDNDNDNDNDYDYDYDHDKSRGTEPPAFTVPGILFSDNLFSGFFAVLFTDIAEFFSFLSGLFPDRPLS